MKGSAVRLVARVCASCSVSPAAAPALAQTGRLKGKVVDAENKPVEGATVTIEQGEEPKRTLKTKKGGGVHPDRHPARATTLVTAEKDSEAVDRRRGSASTDRELNFTLKPGGGGAAPMSEGRRRRPRRGSPRSRRRSRTASALSNAGKYDEAIAKFNEVIAKVPKCAECYTNIGATTREEGIRRRPRRRYKKAIEVNPNSAEAYIGLANVYNAQKKFTEAQAMSAEAQKRSARRPAAGAQREHAVQPGRHRLERRRFPKAQKLFEQAVAADPKHADAHYLLGMA